MSLYDQMRRVAGLAASIGLAACSATLAEGPTIETPQQAQAAADACKLDPKAIHDEWTTYRRTHPFHSQEVAASEPGPRGCRILIVSEPPAQVTPESLTAAHPALVGLHFETHPIGVDGWVRDIVGVLPPLPEDDLANLTSDVHVALFGTAYRARLAPITAPSSWDGSLDVEVRPAEIHEWIFGTEASFWSVDGGPSLRGGDLLAPDRTGVYISHAPGIVLWSLPKSGSFDAQRVNARIFGLESDLVLGAVADADTVLVVGRERIAPESVAPPLRFETLQILAKTQLHELAQSYERSQLFAGPLGNGKDWAPILLSAELEDTELGSVLNIADQLLKRWSLNGTMSYERFDYPSEPKKWAFDRPLDKELPGGSLQFNWNTAASGGLVQVTGGRDVYWMNRTGALHVSYLPDEKPDPRAAVYEDRGRAFFAAQNDPHLVRAVQYTALFQAFRHLGVSHVDAAANVEAQIKTDAATGVLETAGRGVFDRLASIGEVELNAAAARFVGRGLADLMKALERDPDEVLRSFPPDLRARLGSFLRRGSAEREMFAAKYKEFMIEATARSFRELRTRLYATNDVAAPKHLAVGLVHQPFAKAALEDPLLWQTLVRTIHSEAKRAKADEITAAAAFFKRYDLSLDNVKRWREVAAALADVKDVEQRYRGAKNERSTTGSVRTPSIVRSSTGSSMVSGGHNVGSDVATHSVRLPPAHLGRVALHTQRVSPRDKLQVSLLTAPLPPRPQVAALRGTPARAEPSKIASTSARRPPPPRVPGGGWARLMETPEFSCGNNCIAVTLYDAPPGATTLRNRFKVSIDDSVFRATSSSDIADTVLRRVAQQTRKGGRAPAKISVQLLDKDMTRDEAFAMQRNIASRLKLHDLGTDDAIVLHRDGRPISTDGFALSSAEVSEPVRSGDGFSISVSVPSKQGAGASLRMRLTGRGKLRPDGAAKVKQTMTSELRSPEEIARDLKQRIGEGDMPFLMELAVDAQGIRSDNELPSRRTRHAGTTGHAL